MRVESCGIEGMGFMGIGLRDLGYGVSFSTLEENASGANNTDTPANPESSQLSMTRKLGGQRGVCFCFGLWFRV